MSTTSPTPVVSVRPVVLPTPAARGEDLQVRVTAPITPDPVPVIVFSHGFGESMAGYQPLVDHWTANGFAVVQPTHLDSRTLGLAPDDPRTPVIWRHRVDDLVGVLDHLDLVEAAVPGEAGHLDRDRIAVAGHSWGATSASALIGARVVDADGRPGPNGTDPRVRAAVLLALAGHGQEDLTAFAAEHLPFMSPDFAEMTAPALLVAGDHDQSQLSTRGPDWWADGYRQSPAPKALLTVAGGEHSLGGITGYGVTETTDEDPARVALVARVSTAYLRDALGVESDSWRDETAALAADADARGRIETK